MSATYFVLVSHDLAASLLIQQADRDDAVWPIDTMGLALVSPVEAEPGTKFGPGYYDPRFASWWLVHDENASSDLEAEFVELTIEAVTGGGGATLLRKVLE